ncbi:RDD family protein [Sulfitobacter sp. PS-8MA]|uniref:RDD family protein n=1 Tax=Sulfitobacter sp. PS-8MA TaxID=3237707 RepID=UPI0034C68D8B
MTYSHAPATPDPDLHPQFYTGIPFKRFLAWIVDVLLVFLFCVLVLPFTAFTGLFFFPFMMLVVGFAYRVATLTNGSATWGMRLMGMELRDRRDQPFDFATALLHTIGYSLSMTVAPLQLVSVVLVCTTARCQSLTDMVLASAPVNCRLNR